ncbi:hypothetical protein EI555_001493, partial [Monodon monoceros]
SPLFSIVNDDVRWVHNKPDTHTQELDGDQAEGQAADRRRKSIMKMKNVVPTTQNEGDVKKQKHNPELFLGRQLYLIVVSIDIITNIINQCIQVPFMRKANLLKFAKCCIFYNVGVTNAHPSVLISDNQPNIELSRDTNYFTKSDKWKYLYECVIVTRLEEVERKAMKWNRMVAHYAKLQLAISLRQTYAFTLTGDKKKITAQVVIHHICTISFGNCLSVLVFNFQVSTCHSLLEFRKPYISSIIGKSTASKVSIEPYFKEERHLTLGMYTAGYKLQDSGNPKYVKANSSPRQHYRLEGTKILYSVVLKKGNNKIRLRFENKRRSDPRKKTYACPNFISIPSLVRITSQLLSQPLSEVVPTDDSLSSLAAPCPLTLLIPSSSFQNGTISRNIDTAAKFIEVGAAMGRIPQYRDTGLSENLSLTHHSQEKEQCSLKKIEALYFGKNSTFPKLDGIQIWQHSKRCLEIDNLATETTACVVVVSETTGEKSKTTYVFSAGTLVIEMYDLFTGKESLLLKTSEGDTTVPMTMTFRPLNVSESAIYSPGRKAAMLLKHIHLFSSKIFKEEGKKISKDLKFQPSGFKDNKTSPIELPFKSECQTPYTSRMLNKPKHLLGIG